MYPSINIGSLALPTTGLLTIFGAYFCLALIERTAVRTRHNPNDVYALGTLGVAAAFIGARLVFVSEFWASYSANPLSIIWPLNNGYNAPAGLLIGVVAAFFYARGKQMPPAKTLNALLPGVLVGLMVLSLKDFLAGPGYGTVTAVPWAISQFGISRHPVQIYELILGAYCLWLWWRLTGQGRADGFVFLAVTAVYSAGRLFLDAFRDNAWITASGFHIWQIIALILLVLCLLLLRRFLFSTVPHPENKPNP